MSKLLWNTQNQKKSNSKDKEIKDQDIRGMLGLADRSKTILLFKEIL